MLAELGARTVERDPPDLEHVRAVRGLEREVRVLLDDEHGQPFLLVEALDDPEELGDDERREA